MYNTVLLIIVTMPYIRSPELTSLIAESLYHLTTISTFLPTLLLLTITILFSTSLCSAFLDSAYNGEHRAFVFFSVYFA